MRKRTGAATSVTVKSSLRTLEILEYCDSVTRGVTVTELVEKLNYPQSSTSTLVQSMINSGYLTLADDQRTIFPSSRVASLGRWIEPIAPRAEIKKLMEVIGSKTGQTVALGLIDDLCARYIDVVPGRRAMRLDLPIGTKLPLVVSGMGQLLLSQLTDDEALGLLERTRERVRQHGAAGVSATEIVNLWNANPVVPSAKQLMSDLNHIRKLGYALSLGRVTFGAGILCIPLPRAPGERPMGLGVGGLSTAILEEKAAILDALAHHGSALGIEIPGHARRRATVTKTKSKGPRA
jgi:DNA-binding IclR family transcriptional regulator